MRTFEQNDVIVCVEKDQPSGGRYRVKVRTGSHPPIVATGQNFIEVCTFIRQETKAYYNDEHKSTLNELLHKAIQKMT